MTSTATEALAFAKGFSSRTESCARCTMPNKVPNGLIAARLRACDLELPLDRESFGEAEDFYGLSCRVYQTPHGLARFTHGEQIRSTLRSAEAESHGPVGSGNPDTSIVSPPGL